MAQRAMGGTMTDSIAVKMRLSAFARPEGDLWESSCPTLDIYSQGDSEAEAKANLKEAVELWMESCLERNTLGTALRELGWHFVPPGLPALSGTDSIEVVTEDETESVLGNPFAVEVTIPAYQAALLSGQSSAAAG